MLATEIELPIMRVRFEVKRERKEGGKVGCYEGIKIKLIYLDYNG